MKCCFKMVQKKTSFRSIKASIFEETKCRVTKRKMHGFYLLIFQFPFHSLNKKKNCKQTLTAMITILFLAIVVCKFMQILVSIMTLISILSRLYRGYFRFCICLFGSLLIIFDYISLFIFVGIYYALNIYTLLYIRVPIERMIGLSSNMLKY